MFRSAVRLLSGGRAVSEAAASATTTAPSVPITTAAKIPRPADMSRTRRRNIIKKEQRMKRQIIRDVNNVKKMELKNRQYDVDPVLGAKQNDFMHRIRAELQEGTNMAQGYEQLELEKLMYGAEKAALSKSGGNNILHKSITELEAKKRSAILTILNINNTNENDKKDLAVAIARKEFQRHEGDTASPEVQAAVLTVKIHFLMEHVKKNPKDHPHTQRVREYVQRRQRILKYLKKDQPENYFYTIKKLGLTDDVVVREFSMSRQYLQDYKVWGEKQLVKLSDKQKDKVRKMDELQKKVAGYAVLAESRARELKAVAEQKAEQRAQKKAAQKVAASQNKA